MLGWLIYFLLTFGLLLTNKRIIQIVYPFSFWIFVGFRDNIGTDYPLTLDSLERSYMAFSEIATNFYGFNMLDMEANSKILAMVMCEFNMGLKWYYVLVAGIEAIIMHYILKQCVNTKLFLLYFICFFSITYPMNGIRQGLCFMFVVLACFLEHKGKLIQKYCSYILGMLSHYGSGLVVVFMMFKINKLKTYIILAVLVMIVYYYIGFDMLDARYDPSGSQAGYARKGLGLRMYLFFFFVVYTAKKIINRDVVSRENVIAFVLMMGTLIYNPIMRLNGIYTNWLAFNILINADNKVIKRKELLYMFPSSALFFELFEICRTPYIPGAGIWFPYSNWILSIL